MARTLIFLLATGLCALAAGPEPITLPKPHTEGGKPLMQAFAARKSGREFSPTKLQPQVLSDLLWSAYGVNRPDGRRTAPSAMNRQTIDVYVLMVEGAYLYNAREHRLDPVAPGDLSAAAGTQEFVRTAPLNFVFVADNSKLGNGTESDKAIWVGSETGAISQNIYLYCASEGLATVVRASVNRDALSKALNLKPEQKITLAQTVGYPKGAK